MSETLILASINPKYNNRLFIELQENHKLSTCCVHRIVCFYKYSEQFNVHNMHWTYKIKISYTNYFLQFNTSELLAYLYWTCNSTNIFMGYIIDFVMSGSDKENIKLEHDFKKKSSHCAKQRLIMTQNWFLSELKICQVRSMSCRFVSSLNPFLLMAAMSERDSLSATFLDLLLCYHINR